MALTQALTRRRQKPYTMSNLTAQRKSGDKASCGGAGA